MRCYAHGTSAEAKFRDKARERKWTVARAGWPDFLITADGKAEFVEVKSIGWRSFLERTSHRKPPPKLDPVPKRRKPSKYNPRVLGTLERDRQRGIGNALKR